MTKKQDYKKKVKEEIHAWENEGPGFLSNITDFILYPAQKAADLLIPECIKDTIATTLEGLFKGLCFTSDYLFADKDVIASVTERNKDLNTLKKIFDSDDLKSMDSAADYYWNQNLTLAIAEGGAHGFGGIWALATNLPALYSVVFRCVQQIAICYGFDTSKDEERAYILQILSVASATDIKEKQASLDSLKKTSHKLATMASLQQAKHALKQPWKTLEKNIGVKTIRDYAKSIGFNITKRRALMLVPAIGAIIGASFDGMYLQDVARAAKNCYRKRKLEILGYYSETN